MAKHITREVGAAAFKMLQNSKNGQLFTAYLFQELGVGDTLAASDERKQERNVALHDFAVELDQLLN